MSEEIKIQLLKIALELSKEHKSDYTAQRVLGTYWEVYELYEDVQDGLDNRDSSISPNSSSSLSLNQEQ